MASTPYMPLWIGDYFADTGHLSTEEHGAYLLILMQMWSAGGSLPADPAKLARVARCSTKKWKGMAPTILQFFEQEDGRITNPRLTQERQKVDRKSDLRRAAGAKGGKAKALKNKEPGLANAVAKGCQPYPYKKINKKSGASATCESVEKRPSATQVFEQVWQVWSPAGRRRSKAKDKCAAVIARILKETTPERLVAAAREYARATDPAFHKGLHSWLEGGFWKQWGNTSDDPVTKPAQKTLADVLPNSWLFAFDQYADTGEWKLQALTPAPDQPGTKVPAQLWDQWCRTPRLTCLDPARDARLREISISEVGNHPEDENRVPRRVVAISNTSKAGGEW